MLSEDIVRSRNMNLFDPNGYYQDVHLNGGLYRDMEKGQFVVADPRHFNLYNYCYNNPIAYVDSGGNLPFLVVTGLIGAVAGGVVSAARGEFSWGAVAAGAAIGGLVGLGAGAAASLIATGGGTALATWGTITGTAAATQADQIVNTGTQAVQQVSQAFTSNSYSVNALLKTQPDAATSLAGINKYIEAIQTAGANSIETIKVYVHQGQAFIIDGHHRFEAFKALGYTRVPIQYIHANQIKNYTDMTLEQILKYAFK